MYIGGMCVNSIPSPIPASSTYVLTPWAEFLQKSITLGLTPRNLLISSLSKCTFFSPLGPSNAGKLSACVYNQRECELWRALLGQGC